jgi:hypothetical protein
VQRELDCWRKSRRLLRCFSPPTQTPRPRRQKRWCGCVSVPNVAPFRSCAGLVQARASVRSSRRSCDLRWLLLYYTCGGSSGAILCMYPQSRAQHLKKQILCPGTCMCERCRNCRVCFVFYGVLFCIFLVHFTFKSHNLRKKYRIHMCAEIQVVYARPVARSAAAVAVTWMFACADGARPHISHLRNRSALKDSYPLAMPHVGARDRSKQVRCGLLRSLAERRGQPSPPSVCCASMSHCDVQVVFFAAGP